jgi:glutathione S-transferase
LITDLRATPLFWQDVHVGSLVGAGYEPYPKLQRWLENMKALSSWSEVNQVFDHFAASLVGQPRVALSDGN